MKRKNSSWKIFKKKGNKSEKLIDLCDRCMTIYLKIGIFSQIKCPERP